MEAIMFDDVYGDHRMRVDETICEYSVRLELGMTRENYLIESKINGSRAARATHWLTVNYALTGKRGEVGPQRGWMGDFQKELDAQAEKLKQEEALIDILKRKASSTVGYGESDNRDEFMKGVSVGIRKAVEHYENVVSLLRDQLKSANAGKDAVTKDMRSLADIIKKYVGVWPMN
jgi:hypothetical protein